MLEIRKERLFEKYPLFDIDIDRVKTTMKPEYEMYVEGMSNITTGITLNNNDLFVSGEKQYIKAYDQIRNAGRLFSVMRKKEYESKRSVLNFSIDRAKNEIEGLEFTINRLTKEIYKSRKALEESQKKLIDHEAQKQNFEEEWKEIKDNGFIIR